MRMKKKQKAWDMPCQKTNWCRPISALDLTYDSAHHRQELKLGESVSQSTPCIQMMSHHLIKLCESLPCSSDFHDTLLAYVSFS